MAVTVRDLAAWKAEGRRFAMLTAYDWPTARLVDQAGIEVILVGDSVGDNVLGYPTTVPVSMEEMLHHARAVVRGAEHALLVGDLPFGSYHGSCEQTVANAAAFLKAGMHAVKLEGAGWTLEHVAALTDRGIPVMGHIGWTPQSVNAFGRMHVQGRGEEGRARLARDAAALESAGAFALVLEGIPADVAAAVTAGAGVPTIGIGAGPGCDGQVLILHDLLGISPVTRGFMPKFARAYGDVGELMLRAMRAYGDDVRSGRFPDDAHSYH